MPHFPQLDRRQLKLRPLSARRDKVYIERDRVLPTDTPRAFDDAGERLLDELTARLRAAREAGKPRMLAFGAHTIKNGLSPVLIQLMEQGWLTHLATNGAGIIHDWEFAYQGHSSEDVKGNVAEGCFGLWEETGFYLNLALIVGAYRGLGYGASVGALVEDEGLTLPEPVVLEKEIADCIARKDFEHAAAAADLLEAMFDAGLSPKTLATPHPYKQYGVQAAAYRLGIPLTGHPMIGHDIIYEHPLNRGAAIGRTAQRDFLGFAQAVSQIDGGVYMSIGSAVMSPMVFEKSMAMAQNLAIQAGRRIQDHHIVVVDLQESHWDWTQGEPPEDNPDYYLRYNKSFSRMGGAMRYLTADNRDFLLALAQRLDATG